MINIQQKQLKKKEPLDNWYLNELEIKLKILDINIQKYGKMRKLATTKRKGAYRFRL